MQYRHYLIITVLFVTLCDLNLANRPKSGRRRLKKPKSDFKKCHFANIYTCLKPMLYMSRGVNGTGFFETEDGFDNFCRTAPHQMGACFGRFGKRCGTAISREIIRIAWETVADGIDAYCRSDERKRQYLASTPCINWRVKLAPAYRHQCVRPLQAGFEHAHNLVDETGDVGYLISASCCALTRWHDCIDRQIRTHCDELAADVLNDVINHGSAFVVPQMCPRSVYEPNGKFCRGILPPLSRKPKGARSRSLPSFMFTWMCPNVGYGITD